MLSFIIIKWAFQETILYILDMLKAPLDASYP